MRLMDQHFTKCPRYNGTHLERCNVRFGENGTFPLLSHMCGQEDKDAIIPNMYVQTADPQVVKNQLPDSSLSFCRQRQ